MGNHHDADIPAFQDTIDLLERNRPELAPLELDQLKLRTLSRARKPRRSGHAGRTRITAALTALMLMVGTGTAAACFGGWGDGFAFGFGDWGHSAGQQQYRPPCDKNQVFDGHGCEPICTWFFQRNCYRGHLADWVFVYRTWCWLDDGRGGYRWGFGNGWNYQ
jgi:hypothetical protein